MGIRLPVGVALALLAARLMTGLLMGVRPWDPLTSGLVLLVRAAAATLASLIPAWAGSEHRPGQGVAG